MNQKATNEDYSSKHKTMFFVDEMADFELYLNYTDSLKNDSYQTKTTHDMFHSLDKKHSFK